MHKFNFRRHRPPASASARVTHTTMAEPLASTTARDAPFAPAVASVPLATRLKSFGDNALRSWREAFLQQSADGETIRVAQLLAAVRGLGYVIDDVHAFEARAARVADGPGGNLSYLGFVDVVAEIVAEARTVDGVKACFALVFPGARQRRAGIPEWSYRLSRAVR